MLLSFLSIGTIGNTQMSDNKSSDENLLRCISVLSVMIQHPTSRRTHTQTLAPPLKRRKPVSQVFSSVPLCCFALGQSRHIINKVDAIVITSTKQKHSSTWQHGGSSMTEGAIKYAWGGSAESVQKTQTRTRESRNFCHALKDKLSSESVSVMD